MRPKLVLIEGLPGFGKTTSALLVKEILAEMNLNPQLFLEGNLEHPADYDGVAFFTENEFKELLALHEELKDLLCNRVIKQDGHYFLEYRKIQEEYGSPFPDQFIHAIFKKDIYELPLAQNRQLITEKWAKFAENAVNGQDDSRPFVFECCFIQNPVTIGMVKYGTDKEDSIRYVTELAKHAEQLNPLLIYIEQSDLERSFRKAVKERPREWSEGFIEYYTNQGYGKRLGSKGLEGTLQVLQARRELEDEIFSSLTIAKRKVDNSSYSIKDYKQILAEILSEYFTEQA